MNTDTFANQSFIKKVGPLPLNFRDYSMIEALDEDLSTEKASFLVFKYNGVKHERWIPYSQLKIDVSGNIFLSKRCITQLKLDQENKFPPQETSGEIICDNL